MELPLIFGIRHLSPAGAWHLLQKLEEVRPRLVLIEGPCDLSPVTDDLVRPETVPPVAVLAYTQEAPVRSILYPLAEYSPEYQAIRWAKQNGADCRFIDLPSGAFLARGEDGREEAEAENTPEAAPFDPYRALDKAAGEDGHETFWERILEHTAAPDAYYQGAARFGASLRETAGEDAAPDGASWNRWREAHMRAKIQEALAQGYGPGEVVVVTGAYHVEGLKAAAPMTKKELAALPQTAVSFTLMPYSYYRLSSRSGYGAGNRAPAYYELLWKGFLRGEPDYAARSYLSQVARHLRKAGNPASSASVIEGTRLAGELAALRGPAGTAIPALRDLRDAAVTCLGEGSFAAVSQGMASAEIGTRIGALPEGVSRTSIQEDFYRQLRALKLEKYRDVALQELDLDLRENRAVKSREAAFLDLHRSFFLHRLEVLGVSFGVQEQVQQDTATWAERWLLRWSPEAEIQLVESALKGDTISQAVSFRLKERVEEAAGVADLAGVLEDAFACGMPGAVDYATRALQGMAVDAASLEDLAITAQRLSQVVRYGGLRLLDPAPLIPILQQIYLRCCLILSGCCTCDNNAAGQVVQSMERLNSVQLAHDFLDPQSWITALGEIARWDHLNPRLSGFAAAILLERSAMTAEDLSREVSRRLSKGTPAELGAGWFQGLAARNRYALIARLSLWQSLSDYLDTLDEEEFKRALVFLRRAFADFTAREKDSIGENLGEVWGLNRQLVSEAVNATLSEEAQELLEGLDDFDFDDL